MAEQPAAPGGGQPAQRPEGGAETFDRTSVDWEAAEHSPEFKELIAKKKSFVLPATIFFFVWYFGYIILSAVAPDFMAESIYEGLTVGYLIALTQFIMVWGLSIWYVRKADRDFDPLARKAAQTAIEAGRRKRGGPGTGSEVTAR